jgi:hypothetical protein
MLRQCLYHVTRWLIFHAPRKTPWYLLNWMCGKHNDNVFSMLRITHEH